LVVGAKVAKIRRRGRLRVEGIRYKEEDKAKD
jgi:hypothetical protein